MVDRVIDLPDSDAFNRIEDQGFAWFLDDENEEYITNEAILLTRAEGNALLQAASDCYNLFTNGLEYVIAGNLWNQLGIPEAAIPLIKYSWQHKHPHLLGRFDFGGGLDGIATKLIEFNADTCTGLPESTLFQDWLQEAVRQDYKGQINYLISDLQKNLTALRLAYPEREPNLLLTSLGYIEDQLNLEIIKMAAEQAGFYVAYSDLEQVVFDEDAVLLETENEGAYHKFDFVYKLVPWEFIIFEEPELLEVLNDLVINHGLILMNPAYSIVFQAKRFMSILYKLYPAESLLLSTYNEKTPFAGRAFVEKVNFGRLGENIRIYDNRGEMVEENDGDFDQEEKVFQQLASMYRDEDGDIYQAGVYISNGKPSCISFRRRDGLIIDDDAEFISHLLY